MRSSDRFHRPSGVDLDDYYERLEAELRSQILSNPPRPARRPGFSRLIRNMARPALHGSMVVAMLTVVVLTGRAAPTPANLSPVASLTVDVRSQWARVIQVADPEPKAYPITINRQLPRFVVLVPSDRPRPKVPLPEVNNPATV
ncbi:MAG: hypothetical protein ACRDWH_04060 [Acidimicrobiia bacterium]